MAGPLTTYLNSINSTKKNLLRDAPDLEDAVKEYGKLSFIINRLLAYHKDAVLLVNEINKKDMDPLLQYEFLLNVLPRGKRYAETYKTQMPEHVDLIKKYYGYSNAKALEVLTLHSEEDFEEMAEYLSEGGVLREKQSTKRHG